MPVRTLLPEALGVIQSGEQAAPEGKLKAAKEARGAKEAKGAKGESLKEAKEEHLKEEQEDTLKAAQQGNSRVVKEERRKEEQRDILRAVREAALQVRAVLSPAAGMANLLVLEFATPDYSLA